MTLILLAISTGIIAIVGLIIPHISSNEFKYFYAIIKNVGKKILNIKI